MNGQGQGLDATRKALAARFAKTSRTPAPEPTTEPEDTVAKRDTLLTTDLRGARRLARPGIHKADAAFFVPVVTHKRCAACFDDCADIANGNVRFVELIRDIRR
jgi:hypothetical protein